MYFQQRYLKDSAQFENLTGLETIDLPRLGLLSGLEIRVWGICGDNAGKPDVWLHDRLKKVEVIVNGSKVVKSLEGNQLLADMLYKKTPLWSHDMKNMNAASCEEFFYINFGRYYHDLDYMLDLSKVNDPELRFDHDFTLTSQNGWTNGVAMAEKPYYSIIPHIIREGEVTPKGYLKTSEIYRFTSGPSKKENMNAPIGPVYSNLYLQSWYKAQGIGCILDKLNLNIDNDRLIPVEVHALELASENLRQYGLFDSVSQQFTMTGGQSYPFPLEQGHLWGRTIRGVDALIAGGDIWGNTAATGYTVLSTQAGGTGNINVYLQYLGIWPFSVAAIPYFDPMDERTWIKSAELGNLWVRVEENASGGTNAVIKLLADEVVTSY